MIQVALKEGHTPTADYVKKLRQVLPAGIPGGHVLFPGRRYRDADPELRPAGADRRPDRGLRPEQPRGGKAAAPAHRRHSGHRRRASAAGSRCAGLLRQDRPDPGRAARPQREHGRHQHQCQPQLVGAGVAQFLDRSDVGHSVLSGGADAGVQSQLAECAGKHAGFHLAGGERPDGPRHAQQCGDVQARHGATNSNQTNIQPVFEIYASVQGRDLGSVAADINKVTAELQKQLKPGNSIQVVGQIQSMNDSFRNLGIGLLFAAVFVYLLMVVNYQNFGDPFVVILALPATLCGIVTMLFITGTTLNVPSLMGAIMAVGVASANSILLVTFAREQQLKGHSAFEAAMSAGHTRIRPVLMTAAAMIVGMIPMAIGGAGEEQNAALARAVIGGLLFATPTTLLIVPYLFAMLRKGNDGKPHHGVFEEVPE